MCSDVWTASWVARVGESQPQEADLVVKLFHVGDWTPRLSREFADEARCALLSLSYFLI